MARKSTSLTSTQTGTTLDEGADILYPNLGLFFVKLFKERGLSQHQFAKILKVNDSTITHWKLGKDAPLPEHLHQLMTMKVDETFPYLSPAHYGPLVPPEKILPLLTLWLEEHHLLPEMVRLVPEVEHTQLEQRLNEATAALLQQQKEITWNQFLRSLQVDFMLRLQAIRSQQRHPDPQPLKQDMGHFIETVLRRVCQWYGDYYRFPNRVRAAAIYTPMADHPDWLRIRWAKGLGDESRRVNYFYCGSSTDKALMNERGITGTVFIEGSGRAITDVPSHPLYVNRYADRSPEDMDYKSLVLTPVFTPDGQTTLGVLCVDSAVHTFTEKSDLPLMQHLAYWLGDVIQIAEIPYASEGPSPPRNELPEDAL